MFTRSSVGKLARKVTVMNGPSSARGLMTAGRRRLLAAHEKAVTFFIAEEETVQTLLYGVFGHTDAGLNALLQGALTAVVPPPPLLSSASQTTNPPEVFCFFSSSQYVNKRLYTCYYGVTYLLC